MGLKRSGRGEVKKRVCGTCLVLSGGGAKGVYHVGAWKALREMGVRVDGFVGNSIGAIISGFLAQGEEETLEEIGRNITIDYLLNIPEEFLEEGDIRVRKAGLNAFQKFARDVAARRGLDTSPLNDLLERNLKEERIRSSGKDLGVVTFNVSDLKPREVFIEEMATGTVLDYLMASSAFPGFVSPEINGDQYIDGGVYDNMPFKMARKRGYRKIIIVDISGLGRNKRPMLMEGETIYIRNSINMGGVLDFDRKFMDDFMKLGYLDTLRAFGRLKGIRYFLLEDGKRESDFLDFLNSEQGRSLIREGIPGKEGKHEIAALSIRSLFPDQVEYERDLLMVLLDCAATILSIPRIHQYSYRELAEAIWTARIEMDAKIESVLREGEGEEKTRIKKIELLIRDALKNRKFDEPIYYYAAMMDHLLPESIGKILHGALGEFCPELPAGMFYLRLGEEWNKLL